VDRGRLVREAIAVLMMDLEAGIDASVIARRLGAVGRPGPAAAAPAASNGALTDGALADGGVVDGGMPVGAPAGAQ